MPARRRPIMTWLMIAGLALAAGFTTYHLVRSVRAFLFWRSHADEPIQPWMTLGFVAHSYHVPPFVLHDALGLPPAPDHRPLERIANGRQLPYATVRDTLYRAIANARPPHPPPHPRSPPPGRPPRYAPR